MAILDEEIQADLAHDEAAVNYIAAHLGEALAAPAADVVVSEATLHALLTAIEDYFAEADDLDAEGDDDFVDLNIDVVAEAVLSRVELPAGVAALSHDVVAAVIDLLLDFEEQYADE